MKWFKHHSDMYRGRSLNSFHRKFGHTGIAWYYLLTEICTEKLEKNKSRSVIAADCVFRFDKAFVESSLRGTFAKIERWLDHGHAVGLWSYTATEFELHVKYPILLELLDSDHVKTRSRRDTDASVSCPDRDKDKERERETQRKGAAEAAPPPPPESEPKKRKRQVVAFQSSSELLLAISPKTKGEWSSLYRDEEFLNREISKAFVYYAASKGGGPSTIGGWTKALNGWFARAQRWSQQESDSRPKSEPWSVSF